ncbi:MAG: Maf family protein [Bacteroidetes bacterium]|nr:Maf family protein [Bacteroidota bacterium]
MMDIHVPLVLASQSPRRKKLLKQLGLRFRVMPAHIREVFNKRYTPAENVEQLALKKALKVAKRVRKGIIIGADTIVVCNHHILGKPKSPTDAKRMLHLLSNKSHYVYTGIALVDAETMVKQTAVEKTEVHFRALEQDEIERYVKSGSPMDKAGAYGIQDDYGAVFIDRINGCYYNVVGFPLARFYTLLRQILQTTSKTKVPLL